LNTNLCGECDTPYEIYLLYQKYKQERDIDSGDYTRLLNEIEALESQYNHRPEYYILKGDIYRQLGYMDLALENYEKAIEKNPNNAAYYSILGRKYLQTRLFDKTIDVLTTLLENKNLKNYTYYASDRSIRLIAACCVGRWDIAQEDITYISDDYVFYTKPVKGRITKKRLLDVIENKKILEME